MLCREKIPGTNPCNSRRMETFIIYDIYAMLQAKHCEASKCWQPCRPCEPSLLLRRHLGHPDRLPALEPHSWHEQRQIPPQACTGLQHRGLHERQPSTMTYPPLPPPERQARGAITRYGTESSMQTATHGRGAVNYYITRHLGSGPTASGSMPTRHVSPHKQKGLAEHDEPLVGQALNPASTTGTVHMYVQPTSTAVTTPTAFTAGASKHLTSRTHM